ncbi:HGxxPAAW family protein [Kineosporia sp. A_224]|uniref:HGxxPAAW family protein n=1 Tax=Kineosporia sp. A_224 TaxID=1962180 RepID=UPI000B4AF6CD|nr:HGxxPAAW family protein [Kineosporia sp. A_224]
MTDSQATTPAHDYEQDHGNSVAAWTGVALIMLGFLVSSIGVGILSLWVSIAGGVVVVIGAVAWKVLSSMGYGAGTH